MKKEFEKRFKDEGGKIDFEKIKKYVDEVYIPKINNRIPQEDTNILDVERELTNILNDQILSEMIMENFKSFYDPSITDISTIEDLERFLNIMKEFTLLGVDMYSNNTSLVEAMNNRLNNIKND